MVELKAFAKEQPPGMSSGRLELQVY